MNPLRAELEEVLRRHGLLGQRPQYLVLRGLSGTAGRATILIFDGGPAPSLVVKVPRSAQGDHRLRKEHEALLAVRSAVGEGLAATIPQPLLLQRLPSSDRLVLVQRALPAAPRGSSLLSGRGVRGGAKAGRLLDRALSWLGDLQAATQGPKATLSQARLQRELLGPLQVAGQRHRALARAATEVADEAESWQGTAVRTVWVHGDFCPKNLLVGTAAAVPANAGAEADARGLSVTDWETAHGGGLPTTDALYATIKTAYFLFDQKPDGIAHGLRQTFTDGGTVAAQLRSPLQRFMRRRRIDPDLAAFLLPVPILAMAAAEQQRTGRTWTPWHDLLVAWAGIRGRVKLRGP